MQFAGHVCAAAQYRHLRKAYRMYITYAVFVSAVVDG
jgi:hypothetical protein